MGPVTFPTRGGGWNEGQVGLGPLLFEASHTVTGRSVPNVTSVTQPIQSTAQTPSKPSLVLFMGIKEAESPFCATARCGSGLWLKRWHGSWDFRVLLLLGDWTECSPAPCLSFPLSEKGIMSLPCLTGRGGNVRLKSICACGKLRCSYGGWVSVRMLKGL